MLIIPHVIGHVGAYSVAAAYGVAATKLFLLSRDEIRMQGDGKAEASMGSSALQAGVWVSETCSDERRDLLDGGV